jgi:hypothetical protein
MAAGAGRQAIETENAAITTPKWSPDDKRGEEHGPRSSPVNATLRVGWLAKQKRPPSEGFFFDPNAKRGRDRGHVTPMLPMAA